MDCVNSILSAIPSLAALVGLFIAYRGIDAWRREHSGKRRIELAEETLALFYEASDAISAIRNPISSSTETDSIKIGQNESEQQYNARKAASVAVVRYRQYSELFGKLRSTRYRFMALIGREEAEPFDEVNLTVRKILAAANSLARLWADDVPMDAAQADRAQARRDRFEGIFWDGAEDEDLINLEVQATITKIEKTCRSIIDGALK